MPSLKTERIGIFGGAFDPPHLGHVAALKAFLEGTCAHRVYVVPTGTPPHRNDPFAASAKDRLEMARLAFASLSPAVEICSLETDSPEISYSVHTVRAIRARHPGAELFLFVGTDRFLSFETWYRAEEILKECTLCVISRDDDFSSLEQKKRSLEEEFGARCLLLKQKAYIISSTEIREEMGNRGFSPDVAPSVNDYVLLSGLYGSLRTPGIRAALDRIRGLSSARLSHSLAVDREVAFLCEWLGIAPEGLRLAALYHDWAREDPVPDQIEELRKGGEPPSPEDLASPVTLHGAVSALRLEQEGLLAEPYRSAVRFHTTGRPGMTTEEKILYFADYIEMTRTHRVCQEMRRRFYENLPEDPAERLSFLEACIREAMESGIRHLQEEGRPVHPLTEAARLDLEQRKESL